MELADLVFIRVQLIEKLLNGPSGARYTDALGDNSDFEVIDELTDNILLIDASICNLIIATPGHAARSVFMIPSAPLVNGAFVPAHTGAHGDVQVSISGVFDFSKPAKSREEIIAYRDNPTVYGQMRMHHIQDSVVLHTGDTAKVWYPQFTKTNACQTPKMYEDVLLYGSIQVSEKRDMDSSFFKKYEALYALGREYVQRGAEFIPAQEVLEAQIRERNKNY